MINRKSVMYGAIVLTFTHIISQVLGFIYRIVLSRMIGAEGMGLFQLVSPVYSVVLSIAASGFYAAISRLSAEYMALSNIRAIRKLISTCIVLFLILFAAIAVPTLIFSDAISYYMLGDTRTQLALIILLPCILFTGLENIHKNYFYGTGNVLPAAVTEIIEQVVRITAVITLLSIFLPQSLEISIGLIICGMVVCEIVSSMTLMRLFRKNIKTFGNGGQGEKNRILLPKIGKIAVPIAGTNLLANIMSSANAVLIPQRLVVSGMSVTQSLEAFGIMFGMTFSLLSLPSVFIIALSLVMVPRLSESLALSNYGDLRRKISKALLVTSILIFPASALLITLGPEIGAYLFKNPAVGNYMTPLTIGFIISSFQAILGSILNGLGKQRYSAINYMTGGVIQLLFTYFATAVPGVGLYGYIAGFIVSSVITCALNAICVFRTIKMRLDPFEFLIGPALASLLAGLVVNLIFRFMADQNIPGAFCTALSAAAGIFIYALTLRFQNVRITSLLPGRK